MPASPAKQHIRQAAVAGTFYPESADALARQIDRYLEEAQVPALPGELLALVSPHAGYVYSGWVAGHAYKALAGKSYDTVILVGLCHRGMEGVCIYNRGGFETPLGVVDVDISLADSLLKSGPRWIHSTLEYHYLEHSLEVQLPFLQRALPSFKIVPILVDDSYYSEEMGEILARAIRRETGKRILLVASTDLTHYPSYENAVQVDKDAIAAIVSLVPEKLDEVHASWMDRHIPNLHCTVCSEAAVKTVLTSARELGGNRGILLKSANSGDVPIGEKDQVVGYAAIAIVKAREKRGLHSQPEETREPEKEDPDSIALSDASRKELLKIVRQALTACVTGREGADPPCTNPELQQPLGAFVTLKTKGELRGCIGRFEPDLPLHEIIREMAEAAALQDPRFHPVRESELDDIDIEISVLTPRRLITDIREIQIGKHGLYLRKGWHEGTLLPQVATEYNWDVDTFLHHTCLKAGLPSHAWKDKDAELYCYSAVILHEEK